MLATIVWIDRTRIGADRGSGGDVSSASDRCDRICAAIDCPSQTPMGAAGRPGIATADTSAAASEDNYGHRSDRRGNKVMKSAVKFMASSECAAAAPARLVGSTGRGGHRTDRTDPNARSLSIAPRFKFA
jgi:hypothetical protein